MVTADCLDLIIVLLELHIHLRELLVLRDEVVGLLIDQLELVSHLLHLLFSLFQQSVLLNDHSLNLIQVSLHCQKLLML